MKVVCFIISSYFSVVHDNIISQEDRQLAYVLAYEMLFGKRQLDVREINDDERWAALKKQEQELKVQLESIRHKMGEMISSMRFSIF